jgi:hypothetical protein
MAVMPTPLPVSNFTFYNYINDYVDDQSARSLSTLPYHGGYEVAHALTISSSSISGLSAANVVNTKGRTVAQQQALYLGAYVHFVAGSGGSVVTDNLRGSYSLSFSEALPLCWDTANSSATCGDADKLNTNTVISMLGHEWLVLDYTQNGDSVTSLTLGQVAGSLWLGAGDSMQFPQGTKITLSDFSETGAINGVPVLANVKIETPSIKSLTSQLLVKRTLDLTDMKIRLTSVVLDGNSTPRGLVYALSKVLTLSNKMQIDFSSHNYWSSDITSSMVGNSSAISRILVYSQYPNQVTNDRLFANNSIYLIAGEPTFNITYAGIEITNETYDTLSMSLQNSTMQYAADWYWSGPFVEIMSGQPEAFRYDVDATHINGSIIRISLASYSGAIPTAAGTAFILNSSGFWVNLPSIPAYHYSGSETASFTLNYSQDQIILCVSEYAREGTQDPRYICTLIDPNQGAAGQFADSDGSSTITKFGYNESVNVLPSYDYGYITDRGSRLAYIEPTNAIVEYARSLVKAKYILSTIPAQNVSFAVVAHATPSAATGFVLGKNN